MLRRRVLDPGSCLVCENWIQLLAVANSRSSSSNADQQKIATLERNVAELDRKNRSGPPPQRAIKGTGKGKRNKGAPLAIQEPEVSRLRRLQHSQRSLRRLPLPRNRLNTHTFCTVYTVADRQSCDASRVPLSSFGLVDKSGSRGGCVGRLAATPNIPFSRQLALRNNSLHLSRSVHRSRSAHTTRPSGPRSRGTFVRGMPVAPRRFSRTAAHADQVAASRAGRLVSQGHSDRQQHKSARRIDSKVRPTGVIVHSTQSGHGTDHTRRPRRTHGNRSTLALVDDGISIPGRPG